jgi:hypothetical protein
MTDPTENSFQEIPNEKEPEYEELFALFSDGAERVMIRAAAVLALLLIAVQLALLVPVIRDTLVRVERLEGVPFSSQKQQ